MRTPMYVNQITDSVSVLEAIGQENTALKDECTELKRAYSMEKFRTDGMMAKVNELEKGWDYQHTISQHEHHAMATEFQQAKGEANSEATQRARAIGHAEQLAHQKPRLPPNSNSSNAKAPHTTAKLALAAARSNNKAKHTHRRDITCRRPATDLFAGLHPSKAASASACTSTASGPTSETWEV